MRNCTFSPGLLASVSTLLLTTGFLTSRAQNVEFQFLDSSISYIGSIDGTYWDPVNKYVIHSRDAEGRITEAWIYSHSGVAWEPAERNLNTYTPDGKLSEERYDLWDAGTSRWVPDRRFLFQYDASGRTTEKIRQIWDAPAQQWINSRRTLWTYTPSSREIISQTWNTSTGSWENSLRWIISMNSSGQITEQIRQTWNTTTSTWDNVSRILYTYDAWGNRTEELYQIWNTTTASWENDFRRVYVYSPAGLLLSRTNQNWNPATSSWENSSRRQYQYNSQDLRVYELREQWNSVTGTWEPSSQTFFTYDMQGNPIGKMRQDWNASTGQWENARLYQRVNNSAGLPVYELFQEWIPAQNVWQNLDQVIYEYVADTILADVQWFFWSSVNARWYRDWRDQYFYTLPLTGLWDRKPETSPERFQVLLLQDELVVVPLSADIPPGCTVIVWSPEGKKILEQSGILPIRLGLSSLASGVYVIGILDPDRKLLHSEKFVR